MIWRRSKYRRTKTIFPQNCGLNKIQTGWRKLRSDKADVEWDTELGRRITSAQAAVRARNAQAAGSCVLSFWLRSFGTFRRWFRCIRLTTACMQTTRPYLPIDDDDLCRSHGGCTRDALLSRAPSVGWLAGWLLSPPRSRIDRYYFRPVHGTRWIHNALPRARRNAPIIIMRARLTYARLRLGRCEPRAAD